MNGPRDQFFPRAVLAGDQDPCIGGRDPLDPLHHLSYLKRGTYDTMSLLDLTLETLYGVGQPPHLECVAKRDQKPIRVQGLFEEIEGPAAGGIHSRIDRPMAADHHNQRLGIFFTDFPEHFKPIHALHLHVEENRVRTESVEGRERVLAIGRNLHLMIFILEELTEDVSNRSLIVYDQQLCHGHSQQSRRSEPALTDPRPAPTSLRSHIPRRGHSATGRAARPAAVRPGACARAH